MRTSSCTKDAMDPRWFAILIKPGQAALALRNIEDMGFKTCNPLCVTPQGVAPLFRGYAFVNFVPTNQPNERGRHWQSIANTRGVGRFVGMEANGIPGPARRGVVEMLLERMAADGGAVVLEEPEPDPPFQPGEVVHFTDGPFFSFKALVQRDEGERVRVMLDLFGRPSSIPVQRKSIARG